MCLSPENYAVCHILCDKCQSHSRLFAVLSTATTATTL